MPGMTVNPLPRAARMVAAVFRAELWSQIAIMFSPLTTAVRTIAFGVISAISVQGDKTV